MGVVIDTNVLEHADNPQEIRQAYAIALIDFIRNNATTSIYVDHELKFDAGSYILNEYKERLVPGSPGYILLQILINENRLIPLSRTVNSKPFKRTLQQWIHKDTDTAFARITYNSHEKLFVSHDFVDFKVAARKDFAAHNMRIIIARQFNEMFIH